jgi:hypothetical protein
VKVHPRIWPKVAGGYTILYSTILAYAVARWGV